VRPSVAAVSSESGFLHLIQTLLDSLGLPVRTTSEWKSAPTLVERIKPGLVEKRLEQTRERASRR
jgi:hypothetical protein